MSRIALTDGSNCWFNLESSISLKEATRWDGRNHISVPTGSQWDHEGLYYTKSGKWILNTWSQYQGTMETYEQIQDSQAVSWLIRNGHFEESIENLPASIRAAIQAGIEAAEV